MEGVGFLLVFVCFLESTLVLFSNVEVTYRLGSRWELSEVLEVLFVLTAGWVFRWSRRRFPWTGMRRSRKLSWRLTSCVCFLLHSTPSVMALPETAEPPYRSQWYQLRIPYTQTELMIPSPMTLRRRKSLALGPCTFRSCTQHFKPGPLPLLPPLIQEAPSLASPLPITSTASTPSTEHHSGFIRAFSSGCAFVSTPPTRHVTPEMSRALQDQFIDDDEEETCPLCVEEFDLTDKGFRPCPCGYQVGVPGLEYLASKSG